MACLLPAASGIYAPLIPILCWFGKQTKSRLIKAYCTSSYLHSKEHSIPNPKPFALLISHPANNLCPSSKRAVGMALLISLGNLRGIAGSNIFLDSMKPHYWLGYGFCMGIMTAAIVVAVFLRFTFAKLNRDNVLEGVISQI
jgi:hypothetical protein